MLFRRTAPLALALAAIACEPGVPQAQNPSTVDYASFDPNGAPGVPALIPLPNDLALQASAIATQNPSQQAFLNAFAANGGFPNDQEVPITIQFVRLNIDASTGAATRTAPDLDLSSINQNTLRLLGITSAGSGVVAYDAPKAADYVKVTESGGGEHGELTLHKSANAAKGNTRRYDPGQYIYAVRGGPSGVKVQGGSNLNPQAAMYLLVQDVPLTSPEAMTLIPGNSLAEKQSTAATLETLRKNYLLAFSALDSTGFPHREIATMGTFKVAPAVAHVETDPSSGQLPLPSDFLFSNGHLLPELAVATGPFGPLGAGLATLDGFSTTAMILAPTSDPIVAASVNKDTVFLLELSLPAGAAPSAKRLLDISEALGTGHPEKIGFVAEPSPITATPTHAACAAITDANCVSTVIGLQPAVPAQVGANFFTVPPLKEGTTYVVLVTNGVKKFTGSTPTPLGRSTLSTLLLGNFPISSGGKSLISGVSDSQAVGIDQMKGAIQLAIGTVAAEKGASFGSSVVMAYTFKTQTFKGAATQLAALPYQPSTAPNYNPANDATIHPAPTTTPKFYCTGLPSCTAGTVADVMAAYGVDTTVIPTGNIGVVMDATMLTFNNLSATTGAFNDPTVTPPTPEPIPVLVSLPMCATLPTPCVTPLVIFRHGLGSSRAAMFTVANELNAKGYAVAAIDAAKHGSRSFCNPARNTAGGANPECTAGGTCNPIAAFANQGDNGKGPGTCSTSLQNKPLSCNLPTDSATCAAFFGANAGTPAASSEFLITGNLFRTRDTMRQDIIDESQLVRILSPDPTQDGQGNFFITAATGHIIKHDAIYYLGQSLGSISGVVDVAANPRFAKATFNVGGGTITDTFSQSPNLGPALNQLLGTLGIAPGTPAYLQFLQVAKWVLDPADPLNYAVNLKTAPLTSPLLAGGTQPAKGILHQTAACDQTVPTAFQWNLAGNTGVTPVPFANPPVGAATHQFFIRPGLAPTSAQLASPGCVPDFGAVNHSFITDWATYGQGASSITKLAQDDAADFFTGGASAAALPSTRVAP